MYASQGGLDARGQLLPGNVLTAGSLSLFVTHTPDTHVMHSLMSWYYLATLHQAVTYLYICQQYTMVSFEVYSKRQAWPLTLKRQALRKKE